MAESKLLEEKVQTDFRLTKSKKAEYEEVARKRGQDLQNLIEESLGLYASIPDDFRIGIQNASAMIQIPVPTFMVHRIIKIISFEYAWLKVFNTAPPGAIIEFRFDKDGLITGDVLSKQLIDEYTETLQSIKTKLIKSI